MRDKDMNAEDIARKYWRLRDGGITDASIAAKLKFPTAIDPFPTPESAELRAAAGLTSQLDALEKNYARAKKYILKYKKRAGFRFDLERARKELTEAKNHLPVVQ